MEKIYDDFDKMVGEIKAHIKANPGTKIIENDDVLGLNIRYMDTKTEDVWQISITDLNKWTKTPMAILRGYGELIRRAFQTSEGKQALLDTISKAR